MSSAGRRNAPYLAARKALMGQPCVLNLPGCTHYSDTVEHDPPLHTAPHHTLWRGRYLPACAHCQHVQGGLIRDAQRRGHRASRQW